MGLSLRGLALNMEAALTKAPFKPDGGFAADPVPANKVDNLPTQKAFTPGHSVDPVPARSADECFVKGFTPNTGFAADPIPARSL
jgi:hypothetical protein